MFDAQYESNIARVVTEYGGHVNLGENGELTVILTADRKAIAWRAPGTASDRETGLAAKLALLACKAASEIKTIQTDTTRSPAWIAEYVEAATARAHATFADARQEADRLVADFDATDAKEAQAPALAAGDAVGAAWDVEISRWMRSLDTEALNAHAQAIVDGNAERFLLAHARSIFPLPDVLARVVPAALVDMKVKADPQLARSRRQAKARVEQLGMIAGQAQDALPQLSAEQRKAAALAAVMAARDQ